MEQITNGESGASVRAKLNELIGASVLPSMMTEIVLYGTSGILFPLYSQSVDKSLVTTINVSEGEMPRANLTSFQSLDEFTNLKNLYISEQLLTVFPNLDALVSLEILYCGNNQLPSLPSLPATLILLNCRGNQLPSLPSLPTTLQYLIIFVSSKP